MTKAAGQSALQGPKFKGSRVCVLFDTRIGRRRRVLGGVSGVLGGGVSRHVYTNKSLLQIVEKNTRFLPIFLFIERPTRIKIAEF